MTSPKFNGPEYDPNFDHSRLTEQHARVKSAMMDQQWHTIQEISDMTGDPPASVSAQLRHLRKPRFGSWVVERRARGDRESGLFEYRISGQDMTQKTVKKMTLKDKVTALENENKRLRRVNKNLLQEIDDLNEELQKRTQ